MESYDLTKVKISGLSNSYILESDSVDQFLVEPGRLLLGFERQKVAFTSTISWLAAMRDHGFFPKDAMQLCTVTVMAEGAGHNLSGALSTVLGNDTMYRGDNWIGVSRFALPTRAKEGYTDFDAKVNYVRLHSIAPVWCMLDTVATGATLVRGLEGAFHNAKEKPKRIIMGTPAGSVVGMRKLEEVCKREGVEFVCTFFGAAFGLWEDGTGLPWCHPDTVLAGTTRSKKNRTRAGEIFNENPAFCAVGDCSANFFDVQVALDNLVEEEEKLKWKLPIRKTDKAKR